MKKNLLLVSLLMIGALCLTACNNSNEKIPDSSTNFEKDKRYEIYELAISEGKFTGTYEQWLASISGQDGKSAYELYKQVHPEYQGTLEEWLESLFGKKGADGVDGKNAYQLYCEAHPEYQGTMTEWLESLDGKDGVDGKNAYQLYCEAHPDYNGSLEDWLNSLNGNDGNDGLSAYEIYIKYHPEYNKSEEEWINDLVNGNLQSIDTHKIIFESCGGTDLPSQTVKNNEKIKEPVNPSRDGYLFDGWYYNNQKWEFSGFNVTGDITLQAHWIKSYEPTKPMLPGDVNLLTYNQIKDKQINIDVWNGYGKSITIALEGINAKFKELYPNININFVSKSHFTKLYEECLISLDNNTDVPDVVFGYPEHAAEYLSRGALLPLDSYINSFDLEVGIKNDSNNVKSDFFEYYLNDINNLTKNIQYAMPLTRCTDLAYYNKTFFDEFNIPLPKTIQEYETVGLKILDSITPYFGTLYTCKNPSNVYSDGRPIQLDFRKINKSNFLPFCRKNNFGSFLKINADFNGNFLNQKSTYYQACFSLNNIETRNSLEFYRDLSSKGIFSIPENINDFSEINMFSRLNTVYIETNSSGFNYMPREDAFNLGVTTLPYSVINNNEYKNIVDYGSNVMILNKNSDEERLASWLYTRFLTCYYDSINQYDPNLELALVGNYLPIRKSQIFNKKFDNLLNGNISGLPSKDKNKRESYISALKYGSNWNHLNFPSCRIDGLFGVITEIESNTFVGNYPIELILENAENQLKEKNHIII